jgi:hypothetical protein
VQGTFPQGSLNYAVWNENGNPSGCTTTFGGVPSPNLGCVTCSPVTFLGFPVVYEKPFIAAYQNLLMALAMHYSPGNTGSSGQVVAPYIAYVRVGLANGGENLPQCATAGNIQQPLWSNSQLPQPIPAGYIINSSLLSQGAQYIATGTGQKGSSMQTCSPAGCATASDGTIPGWYNAGLYTNQSSLARSIWPGPLGLLAEGQGYTDNGYLSNWLPQSSDGTGYVASMVMFLRSLGASFPFDISAHTGPPFNMNNAYADSEAIIASTNSVGFGKQSVNIYDGVLFAQGAYPTTLEDWAYNFKTYSAPVHHLQTESPGGMYKAAGYTINYISVTTCTGGGLSVPCATIHCNYDCQWFSGYPIYITGNSNQALNGIWQACPPPSATMPPLLCTSYQLQFPLVSVTGNGNSGVVWAGDYWPIIMPFAVQHGVTSIEVWECDLDFAFGVQSTFWAITESDPTGCATWGESGPPGTTGYQSSLVDTLIGQPSATSIRTGKSILVNGTQF